MRERERDRERDHLQPLQPGEWEEMPGVSAGEPHCAPAALPVLGFQFLVSGIWAELLGAAPEPQPEQDAVQTLVGAV